MKELSTKRITRANEIRVRPTRGASRRIGTFLQIFVVTLFLIAPPEFVRAATVQVELRDGRITPSQITTSVNEVLSIHVTNRGAKTHNFVVPDFFVFTQNLAPGKDVNLKFTPSKKGSFPYYSDTGGKPEPGMQGTLTVR